MSTTDCSRRCRKCGKTLVRKHGRGRWPVWCPECRPQSPYREIPDHSRLAGRCQWCGAEMTGRKRKYCDAQCLRAAHNARPRGPAEARRLVVCDECGVELHGGDRLGKRHYCPEHKLEAVTCPICGDVFKRKRSEHGRKTCSPQCARESKIQNDPRKYAPRAPSFCEWCGAEFKTRTNGASISRSGKQQRTNRFCCLEHANKAAAFARTGHGACSPLRFTRCAVCGSAFVKRGNSVTCSDECKRARAMAWDPAYKGPTTQACRYCGAEFWSDRPGARWYCCVEHRYADKKRRHKQRMKTDQEYAAAYRAAQHTRRMKYAGVPGSHTAAEWRARLAEYKGKCAHCRTRKATTKDHVIPKSRGGTDDITNILPACRKCNCESKRDLMPNSEWFAERRGQLALVV